MSQIFHNLLEAGDFVNSVRTQTCHTSQKICLKPVHLAKERAQIAENKAFGQKNTSFSIIHTTTSMGAITALLIRSMELMEAKKSKGNLYTRIHE